MKVTLKLEYAYSVKLFDILLGYVVNEVENLCCSNFYVEICVNVCVEQ